MVAQIEAPKFDQAYERYKGEVATLQVFTFGQRSHAGRRGNAWLMQGYDRTAELVRVVGEMMTQRRTLLEPGLGIIRGCNPYASKAEWCAKVYESASAALRVNYHGTERAAGPEGDRLRQCDLTRDWTLEEKLIVLATCQRVTCETAAPGHGWALMQLARELGICHQIQRITGWDK